MDNTYCQFCKKDTDGLTETQSGNPICEDCSNDRCEFCLEGDMEVEQSDGTYTCVGCDSAFMEKNYE